MLLYMCTGRGGFHPYDEILESYNEIKTRNFIRYLAISEDEKILKTPT